MKNDRTYIITFHTFALKKRVQLSFQVQVVLLTLKNFSQLEGMKTIAE